MAEAPSDGTFLGEPAYGEVVTTNEIVTSLVFSSIGGAAFLAIWAVFRGPLRQIFEKRTLLHDLHSRPPPLRFRGLLDRCFGYFTPVFTVTDAEFVQTAGLDALILCRFLVLGLHVLWPLAALCCAVLIPLYMTGTFVDSTTSAAVADLMRYTLSNVQPASSKIWAPFALSYAVLWWTGYCLFQHYKSYAMLRLLYLRHVTPTSPGEAPRMEIVGTGPRGWATVRDNLLVLLSPYYMLRCDTRNVKRYFEEFAAAEAAAAQSAEETPHGNVLAEDEHASSEVAALVKVKGCDDDEGCEEYAKAAVLPWWLPPERVPAQYSVERDSGSILHGKVSPLNRKRVLGVEPGGAHAWVSAEQYAVLFTVAGPPPSSDLWRLLRPSPAAGPAAVLVSSEDAEDPKGGVLESEKSMALLGASGGQDAGRGADFVAAMLTEALQELFPNCLSHVVRVHNHAAVDKLLTHHEHAAMLRDRCVTQVAAAKAAAQAPEAGGGAFAAPRRFMRRRTAAGLGKAEAELAKWQGKVAELEEQIVAEQDKALKQPLGTAFIALFSDQTAAALAANVRASLLSAVNFAVQPCPGPDNVNWSALWATWSQRIARAAAIIPFLVLMMVFPIGVLTGVLTNLSTAVCSGTPETNSLYWPWYCEQTSAGAKLLKQLLQSVLPSLISMLWDTYVLPMAFYFAAHYERRHVSLSALDHRILSLFFNFNVFNTFLGSVLGGALFMQIGTLVSQPGYWLQQLGAALPNASTYFLNYIIIHALCTNFFRFIWPHEGTVLFVIFRFLGMFHPKCERDHAMIRTPPSFRTARHLGSFLLIQLMALTYAVTAPLVLPTAVGFFLTGWMTWRYCCLYFYERSYESGGRIFERLFTLMVWTLATFSIFTSVVLGSKKAWTQALIILFTQLPMLMIYHKKVSLSVGHYALVLPLQATLGAPRATVDPAMYVPPPLRPQAVGWYPEWGKCWEKYGIWR